MLRKAETVLAHRTDRILLVLERCTDNQNYLACLRTAEILGKIMSRRAGCAGRAGAAKAFPLPATVLPSDHPHIPPQVEFSVHSGIHDRRVHV